jgi:hypothetical protein
MQVVEKTFERGVKLCIEAVFHHLYQCFKLKNALFISRLVKKCNKATNYFEIVGYNNILDARKVAALEIVKVKNDFFRKVVVVAVAKVEEYHVGICVLVFKALQILIILFLVCK